MPYLAYKWKRRTLAILFFSTAIALAFSTLHLSQWALDINEASHSNQELIDVGSKKKEPRDAFLRLTLPFVKVFVLLLLPGIIVVGVRRVFRSISKFWARKVFS